MKRSLIYLSISILLGGFVGLFPKWISLSPGSIVFIRSVIAAVAIATLLFVRKEAFVWPNFKTSLLIMLLGGLLGLHWVSYFHSIQISTVAVSMISLFTYPVMIVFLEPLIFHSTLEVVDVILALIVFIGIMILVPELNFTNHVTLGVSWGLVSALLFSLRTIFSRKYVQDFSGSIIMFFQFFAAGIVTLPLFILRENTILREDWLLLLVLGVFFTAFAHTLIIMSLKLLKAKSIGIISAAQPIIGVLAAAVLLHEIPSLRTVVGGLIVIAAAVFEGYRNMHKERSV